MRGRESNPEDWFLIAKRDLDAARLLIEGGMSVPALTYIEQAAEKFLKGRLLLTGWKLGRHHRLTELLDELAASGTDGEDFRETAELLAHEYLASRYPGEHWDDEPSTDEIRETFEKTESLGRKLAPHVF